MKQRKQVGVKRRSGWNPGGPQARYEILAIGLERRSRLRFFPTRRAASPQRAGAAGFPQRQTEFHPPLPRVAIGILPLRGAEKKTARRIADSPCCRVQSYSMDGPANLSTFSNPKRPLRGED
jgi:hypothetical protein